MIHKILAFRNRQYPGLASVEQYWIASIASPGQKNTGFAGDFAGPHGRAEGSQS